jgi:hypothetical protein
VPASLQEALILSYEGFQNDVWVAFILHMRGTNILPSLWSTHVATPILVARETFMDNRVFYSGFSEVYLMQVQGHMGHNLPPHS